MMTCRPSNPGAPAGRTEGPDVSSDVSWTQGHSRSSVRHEPWPLPTRLCWVSVRLTGPVLCGANANDIVDWREFITFRGAGTGAQKFTWGSNMAFWPRRFFWKEIFSGTHLHGIYII